MTFSQKKVIPIAENIGRDIKMSDHDFAIIAECLYADAGIILPDTKRSMVFSRLSKRIRAIKIGSFAEYCKLIKSAKGLDERKEFVLALTTNVTAFFREPHHFDILREQAFPSLVEKAKNGERIRIWSAGCSNGQEVYSIAAVLMSMLPAIEKYNVRLLASDIDSKMVQHGKIGKYDAALLDPMPRNLRDNYFTATDDGASMVANDALRKLVSFKVLNFMRPWPVKGPFDIIFCRNVVIYFDDVTKQKIWQQFAECQKPDSWLMVGHSERVTGDATSQYSSEGLTAYRRK